MRFVRVHMLFSRLFRDQACTSFDVVSVERHIRMSAGELPGAVSSASAVQILSAKTIPATVRHEKAQNGNETTPRGSSNGNKTRVILKI